jgi:hypothetical protein
MFAAQKVLPLLMSTHVIALELGLTIMDSAKHADDMLINSADKLKAVFAARGLVRKQISTLISIL